MSECLCCAKPLKNNDVNGWHESCIKRFFGVKTMPVINLDKNVLESIAEKNVHQGFTGE